MFRSNLSRLACAVLGVVALTLSRASVANAAAASATIPFSVRSVSTSSGLSGGACPGTTCDPSGSCGCETITGTAFASSIGKVTLNAQLTSNANACTVAGHTGFNCCAADGTMTLTNGSNSINLQLVGTRCFETGTGAPLVNHMNFVILNGTGKFASSFGTGVFESSNLAIQSSAPTWVSSTGVIQIRSGL